MSTGRPSPSALPCVSPRVCARVPSRRIDIGRRLGVRLGADAVGQTVVVPSAGAVLVARGLVSPDGPQPQVCFAMSTSRAVARMPPAGSFLFPSWAMSAPPFPHAPMVEGRSVVLVDDGVLDPANLVSLACSLVGTGAQRVVVATPWLGRNAWMALRFVADRVVVLSSTRPRYDPADDVLLREFAAETDMLEQIASETMSGAAVWS